MDRIKERIREAHVPAQVLGCGSVFSVLFTEERIRNYANTLAANQESRRKLDFALLERGVFVKPEKPFYLSTAHDLEGLTHTIAAFDEILPTLA
jgi:glutamate-1-semialdehyde 2,1-aminomutase